MSFPTLSDLNSPSLVPPPGEGKPPDIGPLAVMVSTVPDVRYIKKGLGQPRSKPLFMGELFSAPVSSGHACAGQGGSCQGASVENMGTKKNGTTEPVGENAVTFAGPYMGAPYAAMLLESLIARGARQIVVIGWCGSISTSVKIGDILLPHAAVSHEGTSRNYMDGSEDFPVIKAPSRPLSPDVDLSGTNYDADDGGLAGKFAALLTEKTIPFKTGCIWTTDAIYRETAEKVAYFRSRGALAVEMECSALFAVAAHHKVDLVPLLVVSDDLSGSRWEPAFKSDAFAVARRQVLNTVIEFCG